MCETFLPATQDYAYLLIVDFNVINKIKRLKLLLNLLNYILQASGYILA